MLIPPKDHIAEIIRKGEAARRLLDDQDFIEVLNDLDNFHLSALVACPTGQSAADTRDHHHRMLHAIREVIADTQSRAMALEAFEEEQQAPSEPNFED